MTDDDTAEPTVDPFYDALEAIGQPVITATRFAQHGDIDQGEATADLDALVDAGDVERQDVSADPVVYYPSEWSRMTDRERVIVFPERRQLVVDKPHQFTRAQLSQFARLVDTTGSEGYLYEITQADIWQAPYDDVEALIATARAVLPEREPGLEDWIQSQWERAHRFVLRTHEDGYVVLDAASEDLMGNIARQKLDADHLRAPLSDTESWVAEESVAEVKRILYDAGYPVVDQRDLDTGEPLPVDLNLDLRPYQHEWIESFLEGNSGVLVGPPGSGKTVAAMGILSQIEGETLVLVPSRELAGQWRDELLAHTTLTDDQIGEYHGGRKEIRPVTIATYQTAGMDRHRHVFDDRKWGLIVFDEVHHVPSDVFRRSADLQSQHRLGLSVDGDTVIPIRSSNSVEMCRIEELATEYLDNQTGVAAVSELETLAVTDEGRVEWTPITAIMRHQHDDPLYRVRARNGREVTVTEDHSLMVFDGDTLEITSKLPSELQEEDYLLQPASIPAESSDIRETVDVMGKVDDGYALIEEDAPDALFNPLYEQAIADNKSRYNWKSRRSLPIEIARRIDVDREQIKGIYVYGRHTYLPPDVPLDAFARLVGLFVADGCLDENRVEFYPTDSDEKSEVGEFQTVIHGVCPQAEISTIENGENCTTLRVSGILRDVLKAYGLSNGAREKTVPPVILSNPSAYEPFIEGLMVGDGHTQRRSRNREMAILSTSSDRLAQGVNFMLAAMGYIGGEYYRNADVGLREGKHDTVSNSLVRFNPKNVGSSGRLTHTPFTTPLKEAYEQIDRYPDSCSSGGTLQSGLNHRSRVNSEEIRTIDSRGGIDIEWIADSDVAMLDVDSVTQVDNKEYVYDLSTEHENFLGNHLFCHNSATPLREDDREEEIFTLVGPPIGTDWDALFDEGFVAEPSVEIRYVPWADETSQNEYVSSQGHERRQLAASNPAKVEETRHLLAQHEGEQALVFVDYLDQGRELAAALDVPFVSGETRHARRSELFEAFRSGLRDTLIVSRVGDEGIDLPSAQIAIVASGLGGSRRQASQRAGRTMRPEGQATMYVLATRGSREEDFARQRMRHLAEKGVRVTERSAENVEPDSA